MYKKMKIALLTLPLQSNYGGIIQNYALQIVLERMGHEVFTININWPKAELPVLKLPLYLSKRIIKKILGYKDGIIFLERKINQDKFIIEENVRRFIHDHIHLTEQFYTKEDLKVINDMGFDAVIVGSDQVWRIPYVHPDIQTYFLDFITNKDIRKLAYAASFGIDEIEYSDEQARTCGKLIGDFDFVSVREDTGIDLIKNKYHWKCKREPVLTLDPTMLLSKDDYIKLSEDYKCESDGELFYYILDMTEDKQCILDQLSKDLGYKPFTIESKISQWLENPYDRIVPPLELWLQAFNKARFVFTDSFHGCVFSILFNKEFIAYGNKNRGMSRFNSLMNLFDLKDRVIYSFIDYNLSLLNNNINWLTINEIKKQRGNESIQLLRLFL